MTFGAIRQRNLHGSARMSLGSGTLHFTRCFGSTFNFPDQSEGFKPPAPFALSELDPSGPVPERPYIKQEIRSYLERCRDKCRATTRASGTSSLVARILILRRVLPIISNEHRNVPRLWFAKTPADRKINNIAAATPPPFCYKSWPCFALSGSASGCWSASFVSGEVSFLRISLCVNNSSR
jgi:hypothetical protein